MNSRDDFHLLCGQADFSLAASAPALGPFDPAVVDFLSDLSGALLKDKAAKSFPDVVTFAFFCRKANLAQLRGSYGTALEGRMGRGLVFHIAPSNVPINFAYSLVAALLAGNACIVKASSQDFPQTRLVCQAMEALLTSKDSPYGGLAPYVTVLTYPRDRQDLTEQLSALCDVRVLWGGDETIRQVRRAPVAPMAFDVTFGDRYSMLCLRARAVLELEEKQLPAMAQGFFNDTFLTDQNACTAPRLLYWVDEDPQGETLLAAQERFWAAVHAYAAPRYTVPPVVAVDKLTTLYQASIALPGVRRHPMPDNLIARIGVDRLTPEVESIRCPGGCFVEYVDTDLSALASIVRRKFQTLSYLGFDPAELRSFVLSHGLKGIDRIVPLGATLDFSLTWDGYDLIRTLSRQIQAL